jgi:hypothetical protein
MQTAGIVALYLGSAVVSLGSIGYIAWTLSKLWGF